MSSTAERGDRPWRWFVLPGLAVLVFVAAWAGLLATMALRSAPPDLLGVAGVPEPGATDYRLRCQFSQPFHVAVDDAVWTACQGPGGGALELVRWELTHGVVRRDWPLPEPFAERAPDLSSPTPHPIRLGVEAALALPDGDVLIVMSRSASRSHGGDAVALLRLRVEGGVELVRKLDVAPFSVRGLAPVGDRVEIVLRDCRVFSLDGDVVQRVRRLRGCPARVAQGVLAVESVEHTPAGWSVAWSEEVVAPTQDAPGERAVHLGRPDGTRGGPVGTLASAVDWQLGEFLEMAPGGALNSWMPAARLLQEGAGGARLATLPRPPWPGEWLRTAGPASFVAAADGRLAGVYLWMLAPSGEAMALAVGAQAPRWLRLDRAQGEGWAPVGADPAGAGGSAALRAETRLGPLVVVAPASGEQAGGLWVIDRVGRYVRLGANGQRQGGPGPLDRVMWALRGGPVQPTTLDGAPDGVAAAAAAPSPLRRAAFPLVLLAPLALAGACAVARGARRRRIAQQIAAALYLVGAATTAPAFLALLHGV